MDDHLRRAARGAIGFMPEAEGLALYGAGLAAARLGPLLEIGSYCGKSAIYLGAAARAGGTVLFSVDHHRGSEEQQPGQEYFDPGCWGRTAASTRCPPSGGRWPLPGWSRSS